MNAHEKMRMHMSKGAGYPEAAGRRTPQLCAMTPCGRRPANVLATRSAPSHRWRGRGLWSGSCRLCAVSPTAVDLISQSICVALGGLGVGPLGPDMLVCMVALAANAPEAIRI